MKVNIDPYIFFFESKEVHDDDVINMIVGQLQYQPHHAYKEDETAFDIFAVLATEYVAVETNTGKIRMIYDKKGNIKYKDKKGNIKYKDEI